LVVEEHVAWLEVSVQDVLLLQGLETSQDLDQNADGLDNLRLPPFRL